MGYPKYSKPGRPKVITLCGSTRFKDEINRANAALTMAGNIVISLGVFGHTDMPEHDWTTGGNATKAMLDDLHRRKIDLADEIMVINVGGYIGESTRGEIDYAIATGKPVRYWALVAGSRPECSGLPVCRPDAHGAACAVRAWQQNAQNPNYVAPAAPEFSPPLPCRWCHGVGKHHVGCHAYEENRND